MNVSDILWEAARAERRRALPVLSFPAAQKLNVTVDQLVKDAELQAQAIQLPWMA